MRHRSVAIAAASASTVVALLLAGCGTGPASGGSSDPVAIVDGSCTRCHDVTRIKRASHDAAGWQATIARMRGRGAQLDDAQAQGLATFLAKGGARQL